MSRIVLAQAKDGMAFEFEGHNYVKTSEFAQGCHKCVPLEDENGQSKWLAQSRIVNLL